jgi:F-type H+-transporting ATPase subunit gamma
MATLRDIRNRIIGVQSTQKITKAMKMVAAAKLRRAQEAIIKARPYAGKISDILNHLITEEQRVTNPFLQEREIKNALVVVITADRGLCGTFNTNLIKEAAQLVDHDLKDKGYAVSLYCIGKKGYEYFNKRHYSIAGHKIGLFQKLRFDAALAVSNELIRLFLSGKFDVIHVVYNEFKSVASQKVNRAQYLPVPFSGSTTGESHETDYIFEKDQSSIFETILPQYLNSQLWKYFLESNASEYGAQMTAMENATTNAGELIRSLQVTYNKERQAAITTEILEIVSGANALKKQN